jgi:hypothetical protein
VIISPQCFGCKANPFTFSCGRRSAACSNAMFSELARARCPFRVLCHEYRRSKRRCVTVREMKVGPSGSAIRC